MKSDEALINGEMIDTRRTLWVIHRVRKIAHQRDVLPQINLLPNRERPPQHAHIQMHPAQDHILDFALLQKIPSLLTVIRQRIFGRDFNRRNLPLPGLANFTLRARARTSHVRIIDRQHPFMMSIRPAPGGSPSRRSRPSAHRPLARRRRRSGCPARAARRRPRRGPPRRRR